MSLSRLRHELKLFSAVGLPDVFITPAHDNPYNWVVTILGPKSTPYSGGVYSLFVRFPGTYPFDPPHIHFDCKMYHVNVNPDNGRIFYKSKGGLAKTLIEQRKQYVEHLLSVKGLCGDILMHIASFLPNETIVGRNGRVVPALLLEGTNAPRPTFIQPAPSGAHGGEQIKVFVKKPCGKRVAYTLYTGDTLTVLQGNIQDTEGLPIDRQCLTLGGKQLELKHDQTLADYNIRDKSVIHLTQIVRGCDHSLVSKEMWHPSILTVDLLICVRIMMQEPRAEMACECVGGMGRKIKWLFEHDREVYERNAREWNEDRCNTRASIHSPNT